MERWLLLALGAALFWGVNALLVKLVVDRAYLGLEASRANLFVALGVLATMLIYDRLAPVPFTAGRVNAYALSFLIGIVWALGNIFAFEAVRAGGKMSQVVPIYNTNTLVAVVLITLLLREIPAGADLVRVLIGALLITLGAVLVS
ncbi:MAG: hypothetical protein C4524_15255 [Candidatus Zixiibacteriota bacterium]|nr:MAG: hypothetical protein C4524_15255 [candidate division Zixibacteria bacterium]